MVGYMIWSRLSKLIAQSFRAAKQYVFSVCSFSEENEDKMDKIDTLVLKVLRALRNLKSVELKDTMEEKIHDKLKINGLEAKVQELQHTLASTEQSSSTNDDEINKQNHTELQDMPNIGAPRNDPYASFFSVWRWCGKAKAPAQDATQKAGYACILTTYS